MSMYYQILLLELGASLPASLQETLLGKSYSVRMLGSIKELTPEIVNDNSNILIVDCGRSLKDLTQQIETLKSIYDSAKLASLLIGDQIQSLKDQLAQHFKFQSTLNSPCNTSEILTALNQLVSELERAGHKKSGTETFHNEETILKPETKLFELSDLELGPELTAELESGYSDTPLALFENLQRLDLFQRKIGGAEYISDQYLNLVGVDDLAFTEPALCVAIELCSEQAGSWGKQHFYRTAYIALCLANGVHLPEESLKPLQTGAFLYTYDFSSKDRALVRRVYLGSRGIILRKDLCSRIKDSALKVSNELKKPDLAALLSNLAKVIGRESKERDQEGTDHLAATILMSADLLDRICYQDGYWNPRAGYALLRKIKNGKIKEFHPAVLACMIKFLSEAITESPSPVVVPRKLLNNPEFQRFADAIRQQPAASYEKSVAISALLPGMRLSRPLYSFDGRQVLDPDITLDQDLIWRIWQLAAIRPLNGPAVISCD